MYIYLDGIPASVILLVTVTLNINDKHKLTQNNKHKTFHYDEITIHNVQLY